MQRNDLWKELNDLFRQPCGIELYAVLKRDGNKCIRHINICDEQNSKKNTSEELMYQFMYVIENLVFSEEEQEILKLSSADERKNTLYYYDLDEMPEEMLWLQSISAGDQVEEFDFEENSLKDIKGFIIEIGTAGKHVAIYKQQYPVSLLERDKFLFMPVFEQNRLKRFDGDILRIDFNCHFLLWNGVCYIVDIDKMEKICSLTEIIRGEAIKSIKKIESMDIVENIQTLTDELDNMTFARKLSRIYKDSKVIGKVSNGQMIQFVQSHTYFTKNPIMINETGDKFILDTKKSKNAFLKLINDDLLRSELTKAEYESLAKNETRNL